MTILASEMQLGADIYLPPDLEMILTKAQRVICSSIEVMELGVEQSDSTF